VLKIKLNTPREGKREIMQHTQKIEAKAASQEGRKCKGKGDSPALSGQTVKNANVNCGEEGKGSVKNASFREVSLPSGTDYRAECTKEGELHQKVSVGREDAKKYQGRAQGSDRRARRRKRFVRAACSQEQGENNSTKKKILGGGGKS